MNQTNSGNQPEISTFVPKQIPVKSIKPKKVSFPIQLLVTLLLLAILFGLTLFVSYRTGYKEPTPLNFEECKALKGSMIQESYPEVCISKKGEKFTQEIGKEESLFCGGIAGITCPDGYACRYEGNFPDAGGVCVRN